MSGSGFTSGARSLPHLLDVLRVLVARDMKLRYKRSVLGLLWTFLNPLSQLLVLHFVFSRLLRVEVENFSLFLFVGIVAWNWLNGALVQATVVVVENRELVRRPGFPTAVLPAVTVTSHLIHFLLTLPVLLVLAWASGVGLGPSLAALPLLVLLQFCLVLGGAYAAAAFHVAYRDTQYLLTLALMLGFYLTPIIYPLEAIPEQVRAFYVLNPMTHVVESYRAVFMRSQVPDAETWIGLATFGVVALGAGYLLFAASSRGFAEEL